MKIQLKHGLPLGKGDEAELQFDVEIRELTAGDLIDAEMASERVVQTSNGPALLSSSAMMGYELVRRSIARIGKIEGPISLVMLKSMQQEDLEMIFSAGRLQRDLAMNATKTAVAEGR